MIILELNEFNPQLLAEYAEKLELKSIRTILSYSHSEITTEDTEERYGLDPWVQWVNIHTGKTKNQHKIEHLSDIHKLPKSTLQIWEKLYETHNISFNVWGVMNGSTRQHGEDCSFFPDPWTLGVEAHPNQINKLLSLPRFYAKNYLNLMQFKGLRALLETSQYLLAPKNIVNTLQLIPQTLKTAFSTGINSNALFTLFDQLTGQLFLRNAKAGQLNILFLNSVAHLQHNYWTNDKNNKNIELCLRSLDKLFENILELHPDEPIMLLNAFRQIQSYDKNEFLYRQKDTATFLEKAGIRYKSIKQLMTNDAHLSFENQRDLEFAHTQMTHCTIGSQKAFHSEMSEDSLSLFYQFKIWEDLPKNSQITINDQTIPFFEVYSRVVRRTGSHVNKGDAFCKGISLPETLPNHHIFDTIEKHFG